MFALLARKTHRLGCLAIALALGLGAPEALAAELPAASQALLLLRVMAYDRNLPARVGESVVMGVAFKKGDRASEAAGAEFVKALTALAGTAVVAGRAISVRSLPIVNAADLEAAFSSGRPAAVFICPGLEPETAAIAGVTREHSVLSATGTREAVEAGLAIGLLSLSGRAGLLVNLNQARLEGADLDSAMLKMAEVLR